MLRLCLILALFAIPAAAQTRAEPEAASGLIPKPEVVAARHMIVAAHPLAVQAGAAILSRGGSAADAAIAALLVLNVVEPQSSGIGGGAFALVHGPDGLTSWDARETAPMAATPALFMEDGAPLPFLTAVASGRSVGVPGLVRLFEALHARHGRLDWPALFAPAIRLAEDGFAVSPRLAASVARFADRLADSPAAAVFLPGGRAVAEGYRLRQPLLAATLRRIAETGPDAFYRGALAEEIVAAVATAPRPGAMTPADLAAYRAVERPAVCIAVTLGQVCGMGPPSSGATTVGQILGLIDAAGAGADEAARGHLFAEASRLAYADRARYLADPEMVRVPVRGLLDKGYLADRARLIDPAAAAEGRAEAGDPPWREGRLHAPDLQPDRPGTTHLSVIDGQGLAISLTASIETAFGSGRMAGGVLLNNQLTDFSFLAERDGTPIANAPAPGKRPRSSMAPTMVFRDGKLAAITGSPGGSRIPEYVAGSLLHWAAGDGPATAVARPHLSQRNRGVLVVEEGYPPELAEALATRGHAIERQAMTSGLHMIVIDADGRLVGGADPRREGMVSGE